jgi:DNA-binding transcriptional LysR family regulator
VGPITLVSDVLERCEAMLRERQVQFVLSHAHPHASSPLADEEYVHARVGNDLLVPVSAPDAAGRPRHALTDAKGTAPLPLLSYSPGSGIGRILREVHGAKLDRLSAQVVFTAHLATVLQTMALDGRGMAWLPRTLIAGDLAGGRLVEAAAAEWCIDMEIRLYRHRSPLGKAGESFWDGVRGVT